MKMWNSSKGKIPMRNGIPFRVQAENALACSGFRRRCFLIVCAFYALTVFMKSGATTEVSFESLESDGCIELRLPQTAYVDENPSETNRLVLGWRACEGWSVPMPRLALDVDRPVCFGTEVRHHGRRSVDTVSRIDGDAELMSVGRDSRGRIFCEVFYGLGRMSGMLDVGSQGYVFCSAARHGNCRFVHPGFTAEEGRAARSPAHCGAAADIPGSDCDGIVVKAGYVGLDVVGRLPMEDLLPVSTSYALLLAPDGVLTFRYEVARYLRNGGRTRLAAGALECQVETLDPLSVRFRAGTDVAGGETSWTRAFFYVGCIGKDADPPSGKCVSITSSKRVLHVYLHCGRYYRDFSFSDLALARWMECVENMRRGLSMP